MLRSPQFANCSLTIVIFALSLTACVPPRAPASEPDPSVERAFELHQNNVRVEGEGVVDRILTDDLSGLPHQRFVVRLASGQTVLIEHNIEAAPRIENLKAGDAVEFSGEYVWNERGGLIHWTHDDPAQKHPEGWIRHEGKTYK